MPGITKTGKKQQAIDNKKPRRTRPRLNPWSAYNSASAESSAILLFLREVELADPGDVAAFDEGVTIVFRFLELLMWLE